MPWRCTQGAENSDIGKLLPPITLRLCKPPPPLILERVHATVCGQHCEHSRKFLTELCFSLLGLSKVNQQESYLCQNVAEMPPVISPWMSAHFLTRHTYVLSLDTNLWLFLRPWKSPLMCEKEETGSAPSTTAKP